MGSGTGSVPVSLLPPLAGRLAPALHAGGVVPRPRLLRRLRAVADAPVILVAAPAGYGKSTLLAQFAEHDPRRVAWLSLDERDQDPVALLHDLAYALGNVGRLDEDLLARLRTGSSDVVPLALPRLIESLQTLAGDPFLIVLDDVHHLVSRGSLDVLQVLCDHAPSGCCLVLSGRVKPGIRLARLKAGGRLWEMGTRDLRTTAWEAAEMLRSAGAEVDDEEAELVVRRTEGWPAAIYLAALVLRDAESFGEGAAPGPDEADIAEYIRQEVLEGVPPDDAQFLVRSSVLDALGPAVCDAVLRRDDSSTHLRALAEADLFVAPVDAHGEAYRIHGLFREMLQAELHAGDPGLERELHRRACEFYRREADWERAIRHAVAARQPGIAADLILQLMPGTISQGRSETVKRWYSWLSDDDVGEHPHAALGWGWAAFEDGDVQAASDAAAIVFGGDRERILSDGTTIGALGLMLRAAIGTHGTARVASDAERSLDGLSYDDPRASVCLLLIGSLAMLEGDFERAERRLAEAEQLAARRIATVYVLSLAQQALMAIDAGEWNRATTLADRAHGAQHSANVMGYATQALAVGAFALTLVHRGEAARAREEADRALRGVARLHVAPWMAHEARVVLALTYAALGDGGQARALLREDQISSRGEPPPLLSRWSARAEEAIRRFGTDDADGPALTSAELRALQYLPTHLSLREIGERLYITRNTVKTHTIAIYRKLGVSSRSEAVERGSELGLIDG